MSIADSDLNAAGNEKSLVASLSGKFLRPKRFGEDPGQGESGLLGCREQEKTSLQICSSIQLDQRGKRHRISDWFDMTRAINVRIMRFFDIIHRWEPGHSHKD